MNNAFSTVVLPAETLPISAILSGAGFCSNASSAARSSVTLALVSGSFTDIRIEYKPWKQNRNHRTENKLESH